MYPISLTELTERILCADPGELHAILDAARERFSELFPDQELLLFTAPGSDPDAQIRELQKAIAFLSEIK